MAIAPNSPDLIEIEKLLFENDAEKISVFNKGKKAFESFYETNPENSESTLDSNQNSNAQTPNSRNSARTNSYKIEFGTKGGQKTVIECFREALPEKKSHFSREFSELSNNGRSKLGRQLT